MELNEISYENARPIDGYGPGFFRIDGRVLQGPVLVTSASAVSWAGMHDIAPLLALAAGIDVLFLGTGVNMALPPVELREAYDVAGVGLEATASPIACRTYNVLLAEGRRIALAALPV